MTGSEVNPVDFLRCVWTLITRDVARPEGLLTAVSHVDVSRLSRRLGRKPQVNKPLLVPPAYVPCTYSIASTPPPTDPQPRATTQPHTKKYPTVHKSPRTLVLEAVHLIAFIKKAQAAFSYISYEGGEQKGLIVKVYGNVMQEVFASVRWCGVKLLCRDRRCAHRCSCRRQLRRPRPACETPLNITSTLLASLSLSLSLVFSFSSSLSLSLVLSLFLLLSHWFTRSPTPTLSLSLLLSFWGEIWLQTVSRKQMF